VLFAGAGDTINGMKTRRFLLMACAVGSIAGLGCSARELDPVIGKPPGDDAGGAAGSTGSSLDAWIAFDSDGGASNRDIYIIRANGTDRRRLTRDPSAEMQPSFSPDGTKLAFTSDRDGPMEIYVMDLATGVAARVTQRVSGAHDPAFTRDGTRVGYRSDASVFTANLDGTDERQVTDGRTCCLSGPFGAPVFASDGQTIIYDDYNAIYSTTDAMNRQTIVMPTTGEQSHPALSPDGSTLVLQSTCIDDNAARSLWTVPATGTTNYSCTDGMRISAHGTDATHASWGPGNAIVWGSVTGGNNSSSPVPSSLVILNEGAVLTLTSGTADDRNPSWSPPGTVIGMW